MDFWLLKMLSSVPFCFDSTPAMVFFYRYKRYFLFTFLPLIIIFFWYLSETLWRPPIKTPRPLTYFYTNHTEKWDPSESCQRLLNLINPTFPVLLIDPTILQQIEQGECEKAEKPFEIAVDEIFKFKKLQTPGEFKFKIVFYKNSTKTDYLDLQTEPRTIIPKNFPCHVIGNLKIPTQIPQFLEFRKRSKFVACRNITMSRDAPKYRFFPFLNTSPPKSTAKESIDNLAKLRDELLSFGMIPFLNGGTLLGWYRECSVIPHTNDMDIGVFGEHWNSEFYEFLWSFNSSFTLKRQIGLVNDSYELTVIPKTGNGRQIDLFLMYRDFKNDQEYRWVGGLTTRGDKIKYIYPDFDPFCATDLMGHIFWVTCTPEEKISEEYGPTWYLDENSSKYVWYGARNAENNGRFTRKQMLTETYNEYELINDNNGDKGIIP